MFQPLKKIDELVAALNSGVVCMVFPTDVDGVTKNLIVTRHEGIISQYSRLSEPVDLELSIAEDDFGVFSAYDLLKDEIAELKPHLFNGMCFSVGSIEQFQGGVRSASLNFVRDQNVEILGSELFKVGKIVFINPKSDKERFMVLLESDTESKTLSFNAQGESIDGLKLKVENSGDVQFWRYKDGGDYLPVIDLSDDENSASHPLVFVVGYDDERITVSTDLEGKDVKGNQVFEKVYLNMLPVECERYLLLNDESVVCVSKGVKSAIDAKEETLVMPVLAYISGQNIIHVTLLARN